MDPDRNPTISPRECCETVYGGFASADAFDIRPGTPRIAFAVPVTNVGGVTTHAVELTGARKRTRHDSRDAAPREPGDRLEMSVIEIEREGAAGCLWFNPWYVEESSSGATQYASMAVPLRAPGAGCRMTSDRDPRADGCVNLTSIAIVRRRAEAVSGVLVVDAGDRRRRLSR